MITGRLGRLSLTDRTEKCRTPGLHDALDRARTPAPRTTLAFAIVDAEAVVAPESMPVRDGLPQHSLNGVSQRRS